MPPRAWLAGSLRRQGVDGSPRLLCRGRRPNAKASQVDPLAEGAGVWVLSLRSAAANLRDQAALAGVGVRSRPMAASTEGSTR